MAVYQKLQEVRRLTNASLISIIDVTNLNFNSLSSGVLEFLTKINYNETANSFSLARGSFDFVDISDTLSLKLDGIPTFTIDSLGRAEGQELLVKVAETKRLRLTDFNDWPTIGVPGEIIYTGIQNTRPEFGEDFIGYLQGKGWVSLTGLGQNYLTLSELQTSPPLPPIPGVNQGFIWIGPPGYENQYESSSQTVYYTDENGDTFDILTNHIWRKVGNDAKFKLTGKVIIGDNTDSGSIQFVDGNQSSGYVLKSDANGNASWQPETTSGGATSCSFVWVQSFTENVTVTVTHNLNSTNILVQLINTVTNELVIGFIDNYTANTVDITLSQTLANVKVIILAANCSGSTFTKYTQSFTTTAGVPLIINHNLGTRDLTFNAREGNTVIDLDLEFVDDDNVQITTTVGLTGSITLIG